MSDLFAQVFCEFYLNPRYLRGSDFLMRFSQGRWAEDIVVRTINATDDLRAVPYGPSSVAPSEPREMELYFERLDKAGTVGKRPDLLILPRSDYEAICPRLMEIGMANSPFTPEADLAFLRSRALMAVEVENSLWVARDMPDYGKGIELMRLSAKERRFWGAENRARWEAWTESIRHFCAQSEVRQHLKGFLGSAKVPTVIIKAEDLRPLTEWGSNFNTPIFVFHVFYDEAYYISFQEARELIKESFSLQRRPLGTMSHAPEMSAKFVQDKNGHILPYVHFSGGQMILADEILIELRNRLR